MYLRTRLARRARRSAVRPMGDSTIPTIVGSTVTFDAATEKWRDLVTRYAGDLPINFLLAWIQYESSGNPCDYTYLHESGIFQLMPPDNTNIGGTSEAALRAACSGSSNQATRPLTDDERKEQVVSGIKYVNWARGVAHSKLDAAGVTWDESTPDFWMMVKQVFNLPGPIAGWLSNATAQLGHPPATWGEMRSTITESSRDADVLNNAEWVGAFGGGGGIDLSTILGLAGLALAYVIYDRFSTGRAAHR